MKARGPFELVDISARTLHTDLDQAEALIEKRELGGLLYAHTYGEESAPEDFFIRVKSIDFDLIIIDDRCLCIAGFERPTLADVVLDSTGYAKIVEPNFGAYALIREAMGYEPSRLAFDSAAHIEVEKTYKSAIDTCSQFAYHNTNWLQTDADLPDWNSYKKQIEEELKASLTHRTKLNEIYASRLPDQIRLPQQYQTWRFNIRVGDKQSMLKKIFEQGLFASWHYASLAGIMDGGRAPVAEALANDVINFFNDHYFTAEKAQQVCDILSELV